MKSDIFPTYIFYDEQYKLKREHIQRYSSVLCPYDTNSAQNRRGDSNRYTSFWTSKVRLLKSASSLSTQGPAQTSSQNHMTRDTAFQQFNVGIGPTYNAYLWRAQGRVRYMDLHITPRAVSGYIFRTHFVHNSSLI